MMESSTNTAFDQLKEKMLAEISSGHPYEALQLAESFVARKKKTLGRSLTSALVFHGGRTLIQSKAFSEAGTLLAWFIEDGAGDDYYFKLDDSGISAHGTDDTYCDVLRLIDLLSSLSSADAYPIVEKIYGSIHKLVLKKNIKKNGQLASRLKDLEISWIKVFEDNRVWFSAYKSVTRLGDLERAAHILSVWAQEGYASEQPLFFARALLTLLSEGQLSKAEALLKELQKYIPANTIVAVDDVRAPALAAWHFAVIVTELAGMEPKPRVDKAKIFGVASDKYALLLHRLDPKLALLLEKVGQNCFGIRPAGSEQPNALSMLQKMMSGGGGAAGAGSKAKKAGGALPPGAPALPPGMDLNAMMDMLSKMQ